MSMTSNNRIQQRHGRSILVGAIGLVLGGTILGGLGGCQQHVNPRPPEAVDATPIPTDEAMKKREWPQRHVTYTNPGFVAGPTGVMWETQPGRPDSQTLFLDAGAFMGNVAFMPYALIKTPVWSKVEYRGATVPPSFTAMPPLPPEPGATAAAPTEPTEPMPAEPAVQPTTPAEPVSPPAADPAPQPVHEPSEPMEPIKPIDPPKH